MSDNLAIALIIAITIIIVLLIVGKRLRNIRVNTKPGEFEADLTAYKTSQESLSDKETPNLPVDNKAEDNSQTIQVGIANKIKAYFRDRLHIYQIGIGNETDIKSDARSHKKKR
jgi:hypothetical protein